LPAINTLTIDGLPSGMIVGQSAQLTPLVTLEGGARKIASEVAWRSSDESIATVSAAGAMAMLSGGVVDISASAYGQSASGRVRGVFRITGLVHETAPTQQVAVAGARVGVQGSADAPYALTDTIGRFILDVETAGLTLAVTKNGYDPATVTIAVPPRDLQQEIGLTPTFALVWEQRDSLALQPSQCAQVYSVYLCGIDVSSFAVHHPGAVVVQSCNTHMPGETGYAHMFRNGVPVFSHACFTSVGGWSWPVEAGFRYEIKSTGIINRDFHIEFTHPN
jgi:hypothetical protein